MKENNIYYRYRSDANRSLPVDPIASIPATRSFTLIELLVVIAIIAMLISILLPTFSQARTQAKLTVCQARQHQMLLGVLTYAHENDGRLPPTAVTAGANWSRPNFLNYHPNRYPTNAVGRFLKDYLPVDMFICPLAPTQPPNMAADYEAGTKRFVQGSYWLFWSYDAFKTRATAGYFDAKERVTGPGDDLLTCDWLYYNSAPVEWWAAHPIRGAQESAFNFFDVRGNFWEWDGGPTDVPTGMVINAGYVDGHVIRHQVDGTFRYGILPGVVIFPGP